MSINIVTILTNISIDMLCIYVYIYIYRERERHVYIYIYIYIQTHTYIHACIHTYIQRSGGVALAPLAGDGDLRGLRGKRQKNYDSSFKEEIEDFEEQEINTTICRLKKNEQE